MSRKDGTYTDQLRNYQLLKDFVAWCLSAVTKEPHVLNGFVSFELFV
jgi:hypothetical protein